MVIPEFDVKPGQKQYFLKHVDMSGKGPASEGDRDVKINLLLTFKYFLDQLFYKNTVDDIIRKNADYRDDLGK